MANPRAKGFRDAATRRLFRHTARVPRDVDGAGASREHRGSCQTRVGKRCLEHLRGAWVPRRAEDSGRVGLRHPTESPQGRVRVRASRIPLATCHRFSQEALGRDNPHSQIEGHFDAAGAKAVQTPRRGGRVQVRRERRPLGLAAAIRDSCLEALKPDIGRYQYRPFRFSPLARV